jgi:uncharacterized protein
MPMTASIIENTQGERLDVTFHPAARRDTLVILGHGLTGNKDRPLLCALAEGLASRGWPCMRISFSGNGASQGKFEDATITKEIGDLQAILDAVPDWVRIAYAGHSMGSAVGVLSAAIDLRIRVLISLAGMTHTADFVSREFGDLTPGMDCMWDETQFPLSKAFVDDLNSISSILPAAAAITQPWLLIHGAADDLVPIEDGQQAFEAAVSQKQWLELENAGHSFDETDFPRIVEAVHDWLTTHFGEG